MKTLRVEFFGDEPWAHNALQHLFGDNKTPDTLAELMERSGLANSQIEARLV